MSAHNFVIYEGGWYYGPNHGAYTASVVDARRFTEAEARAAVAARPSRKGVCIDNMPWREMFSAAIVKSILSLPTAQREALAIDLLDETISA